MTLRWFGEWDEEKKAELLEHRRKTLKDPIPWSDPAADPLKDVQADLAWADEEFKNYHREQEAHRREMVRVYEEELARMVPKFEGLMQRSLIDEIHLFNQSAEKDSSFVGWDNAPADPYDEFMKAKAAIDKLPGIRPRPNILITLKGLRVFSDPHITGDWRQVFFPRSKKKRIRKKWGKDRRNWREDFQGSSYVMGDMLFCHPTMVEEVKRRVSSFDDITDNVSER